VRLRVADLPGGIRRTTKNPKIPVSIRWEASLQHQFKTVLPKRYIGNKHQPYRDRATSYLSCGIQSTCPRGRRLSKPAYLTFANPSSISGQ
jgi:hypothetical protein